MKEREIAIQGIIDLLTENSGQGHITIKPFDIDMVINGKNAVRIKADIYPEDRDDKYDFDGKNDMFECFVIWVEYEDSYERLCNRDTEDIVKIWQYMLTKMR